MPKRLVTAKTGVSFSWYSTTTAQSYRVYRRGAGESYWTYLGSTSSNSYFDGNVKPNNYYRYTVRSVSGSYFSGYDSVGITLKYINIDGMTIHKSKGLTCDEVIIIGLNKRFPSDNQSKFWIESLFKSSSPFSSTVSAAKG